MGARRRKPRIWLALVVLFLACVGCDALIGANDPTLRVDDASVGDCVLNSDCMTSGEVCIFRVCSPPCHADGDCAGGSRCLRTNMGTACVDSPIAVCGQGCPSGSTCKSGFCRSTCGSSVQCSGGQLCAGGVCVGTDPAHDPGLDAGGAMGDASPDRTVAEDAPEVAPSEGSASDDVFTAASDAGEERGEAAISLGAGMDAEGDAVADAMTDVAADAGCGNTASDPKNCGVCGHDCTALPHVSGPATCMASGQCAFSLSSCAPGWTHCNGNPDQGCETNISRVSNCGACANNCPSSAPVCSGSGSTYSCATGCSGLLPTLCGGSCVNTATDPSNCGTCTHACPGVTRGQPTCSTSTCSIQCNSGYTNCSGACVDETSDDNNCGSCGNKCLGGEHCASGSCQCTGGTHLCGAACVANDNSACGASCALCAAPTGGTVSCNGTSCVQGCSVGGDVVCSNACVSESTDVGNCGACGTMCMGATPLCVSRNCVACMSGSQCAAGNTPQNCVNNQWVNQAPCSGTMPVCSSGACVACTSGMQCAAGWVQVCIGNQWVNQTMCSSTQVCRTSTCVNAVHDVGQDTMLATSYPVFKDIFYLFRLPPLAHDAALLTFGTFGNAVGASARMALYTDNGSGTAPAGSGPVAWLSTPILLIDGQREQAANPMNKALTAGTTYWVGIVVDADTTIRSQTNAAAVGTRFSLPYGMAYPPGMAGSDTSGVDFAIYISVQDTN